MMVIIKLSHNTKTVSWVHHGVQMQLPSKSLNYMNTGKCYLT